jgi:hypothetical protein
MNLKIFFIYSNIKMPKYACDLCSFNSNLLGNYKRHLQTKKHKTNLEEQTQLMVITNENTSSFQNEPTMNQNEPKMNQMNQNEPKKYNCDYCSQSFATEPSKRRHELHRCKHNHFKKDSTIKAQAKMIKNLEKQIEILLTKVGDTTNNNNITNNIQINNYGSEDLSHITDAIKTELLKIPYGAVPKLIEFIHFNKDKPENLNIKITNIRDDKISVYQNGKWTFKNKKNTLKNIIDDKYNMLDEHYNENDDLELSDFNHTNYKNFSEKYDNEEKKLMSKLYKDTEIAILNKQCV